MTSVRILLFVGLLGFAHGQTARFDLGTGLFQSVNGAAATQIISRSVGAIPAPRKICYDNTNVLYTNDNQVFDQTNDAEAVMTTPDGEEIWGLGCCCDLIAITYSTTTDLRIRFSQTGSTIVVDVKLKDLATMNTPEYAVVKCDPTERELLVVSADNVWIFDVDTLETTPMNFAVSPAVAGRIACAAFRKPTATTYHIYLSIVSGDYIQGINLDTTGDGSTVLTRYEVDVDGFAADVYCVDYDVNVFALVEDISGNYGIRQAAPGDVIDNSGMDTSGSPASFLTVPTTVGISSPFATGLSVCGTTCGGVSCAAGACPCNPVVCGFCVFGSTTCQCDNSLDEDPCFYMGNEAMCEQCLQQPDAQLLIYNPLARRREGDVNVYGVMAGTGTITVSRAVRVGRFGSVAWPIPFGATNVIRNVENPRVNGFDAPTPSRLRGSRFGVYWGVCNPDDAGLLDVTIPGIVTENSGFTNTLYTRTVNMNSDVTLEASMVARLLRFVGNLEWMFTPANFEDQTMGAPLIPSCTFGANRLTCTLTAVTRVNEGVYEVYRRRRQLRNWHPIFYLFVRQCPADNQYGAACMTCPNTCINGVCDDVCGECVCEPGWQGAACDVKCANPNQIGKSCGTTCESIFPGATNCEGVLICKPGRLGCACRSGLRPAECRQACDAGFWGPNCLNECQAACATTCDRIDGACPQ